MTLNLLCTLSTAASAPAMSPTTSREQDFHRFDPSQSELFCSFYLRSRARELTHSLEQPSAIPRPLSTLPPPTDSASSHLPIFISHLTPSQHKTLQHAAAALLLKHHERHVNSVTTRGSSGREGEDGKNTFHYNEIGLVVGAVVGGWKEVTQLVEEGLGKVGIRKSNRTSL